MEWLDPRLLPPDPDLEWLASRLADGLRGGRHHALRRGRGIEFAQHRSYSQGDDVRLIDWKAFGRTERLVIREAEVEADHRFWLLVDCSASMAAGSLRHRFSKFDAARAIAAGLAAMAERQGDDYGLALLGPADPIALPPGRGRPWLGRLFNRLDAARPDGRLDAAAADRCALALRATRRAGEALVLTDGYEHAGELHRLAGELAAQGWSTRFLCLESTFERTGELLGGRELVDLETGVRVVSDGTGAQRYRQARESYFGELNAGLAATGVSLARFDIDAPWDRQLGAWLTAP